MDPYGFALSVEEWRFNHLPFLAFFLIQKPVSREFDGNCRRLPVSTAAGGCSCCEGRRRLEFEFHPAAHVLLPAGIDILDQGVKFSLVHFSPSAN